MNSSAEKPLSRWTPRILQLSLLAAVALLGIGQMMNQFSASAPDLSSSSPPHLVLQTAALALLLFTPIMRLMATTGFFLRRREFRMALFPIMSLGIIGLGILRFAGWDGLLGWLSRLY